MKISLIGYTGFIGNFLSDNLSSKYEIINLSLRNENLKDLKKTTIEKIFSSNTIINCASSLNPKTKNDFYLNEKFLNYLISLNHNFKRKIIHLSSINTLIKNRLDNYSISKKRCEEELNDKENLFLIRLPLVYSKKNGIIEPKGNILKIFNYLRKIKLPVYPMIYPGHLYQPIEIEKLKNTIIKIIDGNEIRNDINLLGNEKKYLWDIFVEVAEIEKKKTLKLDLRFLYKILPESIKLIIKKQNNFLQQIASIDHSKF